MFEKEIEFIRQLYSKSEFVPLHEPRFSKNDINTVSECIKSSYVSSIGEYVELLENKISKIACSDYAVATSSGTSALHIALLVAGVVRNDEVITQPLSFVATSNAIKYCGANPVFVDVDIDTMGLAPNSLRKFLETSTYMLNGFCINKLTQKIIRACIPVHTFGNPCRIDEIVKVCREFNIVVIEDAAESLGSTYKNKSTGGIADIGIYSFNGNKIVTGGSGGCIVTNNEEYAIRAKHLSTTARIQNGASFFHDQIGYNYRLPNINASLLCSQLENLDLFIENKRKIHHEYSKLFSCSEIKLLNEITFAKSNYWLNTIILKDQNCRDSFIEEMNKNKIMTRPTWTLLNQLPMFESCQTHSEENAKFISLRAVNIPSSVNL